MSEDGPDGRVACSYDDANRLVSAREGSGLLAPRILFSYDADGRLLSKERRTLLSKKALLECSWDAAGRLASASGADGSRSRLSHDALGSLVSWERESYRESALSGIAGLLLSLVYRVAGVRDGASAELLRDPADPYAAPLAEASGPSALARVPAGASGELVSCGGSPAVMHLDYLGSARLMLSGDGGEALWSGSWTAWGEASSSEGGGLPGSPLPAGRFAGHAADPASGLVLAGERALDPATGRFLSEDA